MSRNAQYIKLKYFDKICEGLHRTHTKIVHQGLVGFDEGCQRVKAFCSSEVEMFFECIEPEAHLGTGWQKQHSAKRHLSCVIRNWNSVLYNYICPFLIC